MNPFFDQQQNLNDIPVPVEARSMRVSEQSRMSNGSGNANSVEYDAASNSISTAGQALIEVIRSKVGTDLNKREQKMLKQVALSVAELFFEQEKRLEALEAKLDVAAPDPEEDSIRRA